MLEYRNAPNPAGNSATSSGVYSPPLTQNTPALRPPNRRAGVSGAKKARMLMKVTAGLPAWFGSVGVTWRFQSGESFCGGVWGRFDPTRAEHTRPTVGRVCPAQKSPNAHEGNRRITRPVWESWGGAAFPIRRVILRWCLGKIRSHSRRTHPPYGPDIQPWAYA
jgi:hypothetical protein